MPDDTGKLTESDKSKVAEWFNRHRQGRPFLCPICGSGNWSASEHLVQPVTLGAERQLLLGGIGYPHVMFISNPCGYTIFFNAVLMGIVPGTEGDKK